MKSKSLCKENEKGIGGIYINRDSVCLYNDSKIKKKRFFFKNFLIIYKKSEIGSGERGMWEVFETKTV